MRAWGPIDRTGLTAVDGGVTAARGFRAGAALADLKPSGNSDLALVAAHEPVGAAVVSTTNRVKAAPNQLSVEHASNGRAQAVVINAGNANACTGDRGMADARRTAEETARLLGSDTRDVLVLSTGVIGVPMPIERLVAALPAVTDDLAEDGAARAAEAILTTDTRSKLVAYEVATDTGRCIVGGIAKGSGMIEPAMATMLAVITTDAPVTGAVLRPMLKQAVAKTFNRISVDGCGSTNDAVVLLASGRATQPPGLEALQRGIEAVCAALAYQIVKDGEGTTRIATVTVGGAESERDAETLARAICSSTLFRAALHGGDPNWGRIIAAMGSTPVEFEPARVSVACGGVTVCRFGTATSFDRGQAAAAMSKPEVAIEVDVGMGRATATMLVSDLSRDYVTINSEYTT